MKYFALNVEFIVVQSPLAEGRELKLCAGRHDMPVDESPLAEGRELK